MSGSNYIFDWSDLAFSSKSEVNNLRALFVLAPREMSENRFIELVKEYLPKGNILLGISKEKYVTGFDGQPQFKTLSLETVQKTVDKVNSSNSKYKVTILKYSQTEASYVLDKLKFRTVLLVSGSWQYSFHNTPLFYNLVKKNVNYNYISAFSGREEALSYDKILLNKISGEFSDYVSKVGKKNISEKEMMDIANHSSRQSYDYTYQTGASLGRPTSSNSYDLVTSSFNKVVPFQTYALLNGSVREKNFSPPNDLNHYDTNHAEVELLVIAQREKIDLKGTVLFINLLPCPTCSRMLSDTDIVELVYSQDHSDGYAVKLFEDAGKTVRRLIT
jgi:deoxycytidylate deaminase